MKKFAKVAMAAALVTAGFAGVAAEASYAATTTMGSTASWFYTPSGYSTQGKLTLKFATTVTYGIPETYAQFSGTSRIDWYSTNPWKPTSMSLTDTFRANGLSISVSLPFGAGFSGSGSEAKYSTSTTSLSYQAHSYQGIRFNGAVIYSVEQATSTTLAFGGTYLTKQLNDYKYI